MTDDWIGLKRGKVVGVHCSYHNCVVADIHYRRCGQHRFGRCNYAEGYRVKWGKKEKDILVIQPNIDDKRRKRRNKRRRRQRRKAEKALLR